MFFIIFNVILILINLYQTQHSAEVVTISFKGSLDGYAVIEEAVIIKNYSGIGSRSFETC